MAKYLVLTDFADKYDVTKVYKKGKEVEFPESFKEDRINSLIDRKIISLKEAPKKGKEEK